MKRFLLAAAAIAFFSGPAVSLDSVREKYDANLSSPATEPIATAMLKYVAVIERTHNDQANASTFPAACRGLCMRVFREDCEAYAYSCPPIGADIWSWPADIDNDAIYELKANVPALRHCPDVYLLEVPLPMRRFEPQVSCELVKKKAAGWASVALLLNDEGTVTNASVVESTSELLDDSAIEAALRFR